jgi:GNAT superfamily N-acetyltransferase
MSGARDPPAAHASRRRQRNSLAASTRSRIFARRSVYSLIARGVYRRLSCDAVIRPLKLEDAETCDQIIASLPAWFGMDEGIRECAAAVRSQPGLVALVGERVVGFLTVTRPFPGTPEISWLAVHASHRGRGFGTELVRALSDELRAGGDRLLLVKTLSDRTDPGPEYAQTRGFYLTRGFQPVAELDLYGPENPIQLLALPL